MQNYIEHKFSKMISKRNSDAYTITKSRSYFFLIFIIGFVLGIIFFTTSNAKHLIISDLSQVNNHLKDILLLSNKPSALFVEIIKISEIELCNVFFIFISGFTYFCFIASGTVVFSKGIMFGFSSAYLMLIPQQTSSINIKIYTIVFFLTKLFISIITTLLASETYVFSYDFRAIKQNCSILRRASVTYKFAFLFIKTLGGCILFNLIYCLLIKSLKT